MHTKPFLIILILIPMCLTACRDQGTKADKDSIPITGDTGYEFLVADTITYDVMISNPYPDDSWATICLSRLNRKALVDSVFSMVYRERATAYNFETLEKMTVKQVIKMESAAGFSRDNISMIQFTEAWYLDAAKAVMTKRVISLVLGYNFYASDGELFGHKPVFRIDLNRDKGRGTRDKGQVNP